MRKYWESRKCPLSFIGGAVWIVLVLLVLIALVDDPNIQWQIMS